MRQGVAADGITKDMVDSPVGSAASRGPRGLLDFAAGLMPVPARDDKDIPGRHLDGDSRCAEELHHTAQRDDEHVSVGVPVHVVDETGR